MKSKVFLAFMIMAGFVVSAVADESKPLPPQMAQPVALVPAPSFSSPPVIEGEKITHSFAIKNTGSAPLVIIKVETTCGCTTADFTKVIAPGGEGSVTLRFNTKGYGGRSFSKSATVFTNSLVTGKIMLRMTGQVDEWVKTMPDKKNQRHDARQE